MAGRHAFGRGSLLGKRASHVTAALAAVVAVLFAASRGAAFEPVRYYGFDADAYSPAAQEGLQEIFAGRLFNFSVPTGAARMLLGGQTAFAKELGFQPDSPEALFYAYGRFPSPANRAQGADAHFGLGESVFVKGGSSVVNINCFSCHAGVVNGQVVAGMGNSHINQSDPRNQRTRGDNFGPYEVWRLGARIGEPETRGMVLASKKTELQTMFESIPLPPVDPMPWWLMKYKRLNYWYADGGSHSAANFSVNFTVPQPEINARRPEHVKTVAKALAFARETQSPLFPGSLDGELVKRGADLFHGRTRPADTTGFRACKGCHGTYTRKPEQNDGSRPGSWSVDYDFSDVLRNVGTDTSYNATLQKLKPIADNINKLAVYFAAQGTPELIPHATVPDKEGYVAPPLVGVWASAPYFHNGSVPTIEYVLNSSLRPEIWARDNRDPHAYDLVKVGMRHRTLSRADFDASASAASGKSFLSTTVIDHGTIFDTQQFGHGNMGHTFGDHLTSEERSAVIEFLKSLSGPDM